MSPCCRCEVCGALTQDEAPGGRQTDGTPYLPFPAGSTAFPNTISPTKTRFQLPYDAQAKSRSAQDLRETLVF